MRRIITFLGIRPIMTSYEYRNQVASGRVFPEALAQFVDFDAMNVLVTEEARQNSLPVLKQLEDPRISAVDIPDGRDQKAMWDIFSILTELVQEGDVVTFDITHGLRSIPFLVFLAAAFLRSARRATIEAVYYGAYELGDMKTDPVVPAPVVDLSEFVDLLEWMQAAAHFEATGNGLPLADLIQSTNDGALDEAASALRATTRGLRLGLATQVGQSVAALTTLLWGVPDRAKLAAAPARILVDRIASKYEPLALSEELDSENAPLHLRQHAALISWYVANDLALQAWLLAREWLVTWTVMGLGESDLLDRDARGLAEQYLREASIGGLPTAEPEQRQKAVEAEENLRGVKSLKQVLNLWSQTVGIRNELAHMSMRPKSRSSSAIMRRLHHIQRNISQMAERWLPISPQQEMADWNPWGDITQTTDDDPTQL